MGRNSGRMRAIWSGAISFGLVNIPVKIYSAVGENILNLEMLSKEDQSPIRYLKVNALTGEEVDYKDIVKGYKIEEGKYVILHDKDFEKANAKKTKTIEISDFVLEDEIGSIYYEKPYFLEPDKGAEKPYALLREALKKSKKVGIGNYVFRNKEHLGVLKVFGDVILLNQLRFQHDIRDFKDLKLPKADLVNKSEMGMALKLIDQLTDKFRPENFKDTYKEELMTIIEAKAKGIPVKTNKPAQSPGGVKDLMATLKASLSDAKKKPTDKQRPPAKKETTRSKAKSSSKK